MKLLPRKPDLVSFTDATALRARIAELEGDREALEAQLDGRPRDAASWLQRKVIRQRQPLDRLQRKVEAQRFVLRTLDGLGRSLSADEYRTARDAQPERLRERIPEE